MTDFNDCGPAAKQSMLTSRNTVGADEGEGGGLVHGVIVTLVAQASGILRDTAPHRGDMWRKSCRLSYQSAAV